MLLSRKELSETDAEKGGFDDIVWYDFGFGELRVVLYVRKFTFILILGDKLVRLVQIVSFDKCQIQTRSINTSQIMRNAINGLFCKSASKFRISLRLA